MGWMGVMGVMGVMGNVGGPHLTSPGGRGISMLGLPEGKGLISKRKLPLSLRGRMGERKSKGRQMKFLPPL